MLSDCDIHAPWLTSPVEQRSQFYCRARATHCRLSTTLRRARTLAEFKRVLGSKASAGVGMEE